MLSVKCYKEEILSPILAQFTAEPSRANAYCVICAVDSYATHMALDGVGMPENAASSEVEFKDKVTEQSWQFRVIRETSNATKHAIRKESAKDVRRSSDVKPNTGIDLYAWFSGVFEGGLAIDLDWKYREGEDGILDSTGKKVEGFAGFGPRTYLSTIIDAAIAAIEEAGARSRA